jgi:hypothetical protein
VGIDKLFKVVSSLDLVINQLFPAFVSLLSPGEPEFKSIVTATTLERAMTHVQVFHVFVQQVVG